MKAPIPSNETQRLEALRQYAILDSAREQSFDDMAAMAAYICDVPMATISLVDSNRQWFKSTVGMSTQETSRDIAFCAHTILTSEPTIVRDALEDPRFRDSELVVQEPRIRFYAGFPLTTPAGLAVGALCAIDRKPNVLNDGQKNAMSALARQVIALLELRRVSAQLAESLGRVKTLEGLLPICAWCKRIRDEAGSWSTVERYVSARTDTSFTHGICPDCLKEVRVKAGKITEAA